MTGRGGALGFSLCVAFCLVQYGLRTAPAVMSNDLAQAFDITPVEGGGLSSSFVYTYALGALESGAALDFLGARGPVPAGAAIMALGALLFASDGYAGAEVGAVAVGPFEIVSAHTARWRRGASSRA